MRINDYKWILRVAVILFAVHYSLIALAERSNSARSLPQGRENYPYRSDYLWLTVPDHANWLYKTGEKAMATRSGTQL
ncbi:MAG: hypothetical protein J6W43_06635 [Prevotella sp.]|nr:hypothetical protein [Prevotella sp.]